MPESKPLREIRINPVVPAEAVLVATARAMRPREAEQPAPRDARERVAECPFCRGNEARTPPTVAAWPRSGDWAVRVVENLFPVLGADGGGGPLLLGLQQAIDGYGRHEVIIDHPRHGIALHEMETAHLVLLLTAYRERMRALYASDARLRYVLAFKNYGKAAGASIGHTHSQVIAMPVVPQNVQDEFTHARAYHARHGHCIFCALVDEALTFEATVYDRDSGEVRRRIDVGQYVVERNARFIAVKPFASRFEWEVQILPLTHQADYLALADDDLPALATLLRNTMQRLDAVIGGAQYNFFLHSLPHCSACADGAASFHWHLEICPRTSIPTGFELGSGLFVNTVSPEEAAARLRAVTLEEASGEGRVAQPS
jgi:UDPglucose--hexose-1-phosphate uridylyltransferase